MEIEVIRIIVSSIIAIYVGRKAYKKALISIKSLQTIKIK